MLAEATTREAGRQDMTEGEWLTCTEPGLMLAYLEGRAVGWKTRLLGWLGFRADPIISRKVRLFGCACYRRGWQFLNATDRERVESSEGWVDRGSRKASGDPFAFAGVASGWAAARINPPRSDLICTAFCTNP